MSKTKKTSLRSNLLLTYSGRYVHLSEISVISRSRFSDEDGLMNALATEAPPGRCLWIKTKNNIVDAIILSEAHNMYIVNKSSEDLNQYASSTPERLYGEDLTEYIIISSWEKLHHG